jgi:hypothetical protein
VAHLVDELARLVQPSARVYVTACQSVPLTQSLPFFRP